MAVMTPDILVHWSRFDALDAHALHDLLKLRMDVFVVEQACPYPDIDGRDPEALHLRLTGGPALIGCLRLFPPQTSQDRAVIGRLAVAKKARGQQFGQRLMHEALTYCRAHFPLCGQRLEAQNHLRGFYAAFGFTPVSDVYDEDGIPHVRMERAPR